MIKMSNLPVSWKEIDLTSTITWFQIPEPTFSQKHRRKLANLSWKHECNESYPLHYIIFENSVCLCILFRGWPVMCITFSFSAYSIIKRYSFSSNFYGKVLWAGSRLCFYYSSPTFPTIFPLAERELKSEFYDNCLESRQKAEFF